jgi:uracil phosphoribosyltransferase
MRFRTNLERVGEVLAYELSKTLRFEERVVTTPLGESRSRQLADVPVLATVLRAGLPMYLGALRCLDRAESAFAGAYRVEGTKEDLTVNLDYLAAPDLTGKVLILIDPMLATGNSLVLAYESFLRNGKPREVHIMAAIASRDGVNHIQRSLPEAKLWLGAIDEELNHTAYIVPGLGDAGDLAFGPKL